MTKARAKTTGQFQWRGVVALLLLWGLVFVVQGARAETEGPGNRADAVVVGLNDYVRLVVQNNEEVASQFLEYQIRQESVKSEEGEFEPEFLTSYQRSVDKIRYSQEEKSASIFAPERDEKSADFNAAVELRTYTGTTVRLSHTTREYRDRASDPDDQFKSQFMVEVTQPLLKGAGMAPRARIEAAMENAQEAFHTYRLRKMDTLLKALSACWDYYGAKEKLRIRRESVKIAEQIVKDNRTRVQLGKMAETEILEAEAGLTKRKALESRAEQDVVAALNTVRSYISFSQKESALDLRFDDELEIPDRLPKVSTSMQKAVVYRPEFNAARRKIKREEILLQFAKNQRWPQLDLRGTYGLNGLGDTTGDSWEDALKEDFRTWRVGATLSFPLFGGIKNRSEVRIAKLNKRRAILELKALEVEIYNGISTAVKEVESAIEQLVFHSRTRQTNELLLEVELTRFEAGRSNSRAVLTKEEDLISEREAELDGLVYTKKVLLSLAMNEGILLRDFGVEDMKIER